MIELPPTYYLGPVANFTAAEVCNTIEDILGIKKPSRYEDISKSGNLTNVVVEYSKRFQRVGMMFYVIFFPSGDYNTPLTKVRPAFYRIAGKELTRELAQNIQNVLVSQNSKKNIKKT